MPRIRRRSAGLLVGSAIAILGSSGCGNDAVTVEPPASVIAETVAIPTAPPTTPPATPARSAPDPANDPANDDEITPPDAETLRILRQSDADLPVIAIRVADARYDVELAATHAARMRGLGGRKTFPKGTGMLFVHPEDLVRRYWMKDCLVGMDIAFLDREARIIAMHRMTPEALQGPAETSSEYAARLRRYPSRRPARYALEVPPGDLERLGLRLGDRLPLPRAPLDALAGRERISGRP